MKVRLSGNSLRTLRATSLMIALTVLLISPSLRVFATSCNGLSQLDCQAIYGGWTSWVPDDGSGGTCGGDVTLIGGDNETKVWNFFKSQGLDDIHTAGVMGNIQTETAGTWNPEIIQGGGTTKDPSTVGAGVGWGIVQWTPGSKALDVAKTFNISTPIYELGTQLNMVWEQMQPNSAYSPGSNWSLTDFKAMTTVADIANYFNANFEISADVSSARATNATNILAKYSGQGGDSTSTGTVSSCGSPDCTSTTGSAKILCAAQKYKGIWYEFGGAHAGREAFVSGCPDPSSPPNNQASGKIGSDGSNGNPSPCAVDCSGLVSMAVDDAFDQKFDWAVADITQDSSNWKKLNTGSTTLKQALSNAQPGDVVTEGTEHVVIFMSLNGNTVTDFEASETGTQVGQMTHDVNTSGMDGVYQYIGPGSNS